MSYPEWIFVGSVVMENDSGDIYEISHIENGVVTISKPAVDDEVLFEPHTLYWFFNNFQSADPRNIVRMRK